MTTTTRGAVRFQEGIDLAGTRIVNLATPLIAGDAATKAYVDSGGTSVVNVSPIGGGTDDWEYLFDPTDGVAVSAAATGRPLVLTAGTYRCDSVQVLPSGLMLVCEPGVVIESSLTPTPGGGQTRGVFVAYPSTLAGTTDTTLANAAAVGDTSVVVTSTTGKGFSVGGTIIFGEGNRFFYYLIRAIAGTTITLDRPVVSAFAAGVAAGARVVPTGIRIYGNGARVRGTGDRAVGITGGYRCLIDGLVVEPNDAAAGFGDTWCAFDIGSRFSTFHDVRVDNGGLGIGAFSLESAESCVIDTCEARRATDATLGAGFLLGVAYNCKVRASRGYQCKYGIYLNSGGGADKYGCRQNQIADCDFRFNSSAGIAVTNGSSFNKFSNCNASDNGTFGAYVSAYVDASEPSRSNAFVDCSFDRNTSGGVQTIAGSGNTTLDNCQAENCGGVALDVAGNTQATNFYSSGCTNGAIQVTGTADLKLCNVELSSGSLAGFWLGILLTGSGRVDVTNYVCTMGTVAVTVAQMMFQLNGGTGRITAAHCKARIGAGGAANTYGIATNAGQVVLDDVDLSATANPSDYTGAKVNFGTVIANGAGTGQTVAAVCTVASTVLLSRKADGGTPGVLPKVVPAAGQFTFTAPAGDTSTYVWTVHGTG